MTYPNIQRRATRTVSVGNLTIGADAPVRIQSMTNTTTADVESTTAQIRPLAHAGADLVRVAAATRKDTAALPRIIRDSPVPIIADVHFHFERALEAISAGVPKIRLNPGNIADRDQVRRVIAAAANAGAAIRVGVNEGSIVNRIDPTRRRATDLARPLDKLMTERLDEYLQVFREADFHNLVLSAKSHDAVTTVTVNRRIAAAYDYPLHLGVTHAGTPKTGAIRSAAAIGTLLAEGIGDTIRISYAGDPLQEVAAAVELLAALRRNRPGVDLLACPTCGRASIDIAPIAEQLSAALSDIRAPITVAVMGCVVNGPGEAENADIAVCAAGGHAVLYRRGKRIRTVPADQIVQTVVDEVHMLLEETS